ncbi:MAG: D-alanine-D-alanine ligase-like ATP-grasp enzyme [Gammaproteobacteria bacterium]|jgi:D-alanine-D-alanine ligase-like ATP-grasp enzyme
MNWLKTRIYHWISQRYMHGCSSYNDLAVRRSCRSKEQGRAKFAGGGLPHARGMIFFNPLKAIQFAKEHGFPLVIKPNVSGYSRGSYFPINNFGQLWKAILLAKIWWPTTVIEQYLKGANYRVVVIDGKIMSVIQRYPPFVIGNGEDTISDLIDAENAIREQMQLYGGMFPIKKDQRIKVHLKKQGLTFESVPAKDEHIELYFRVALAPGGIVRIIDKTSIHADNIKLFLDTLQLFKANILGVDIIFENSIEQSHKDQKCILLEVNSRPYLKMHDYPRYGEKEDLSAYYNELDQLDISQPDTF